MIAHDELDIPPGSARFKDAAVTGHGLRDIIPALGTESSGARELVSDIRALPDRYLTGC